MEIGMSTACLYPQKTEEALRRVGELQFKLTEIFFNTYSELQPEFLLILKNIKKNYNLEIRSIHPFTSAFETMLLFSDYPRRFQDGLKFYENYFRAADFLDARFLVLHGQRGYLHGRITEEEYFEHYRKLFLLGKKFGITVAQENVNGFRSESAKFISKMRQNLGDDCAFVLDVKQAVRAGENPVIICKAMGNKLVHVHLNDNIPQKDCLLPGCGTFDFVKFFTILEEMDFKGDGVIEVYRKDFSEDCELINSRKWLENCKNCVKSIKAQGK